MMLVVWPLVQTCQADSSSSFREVLRGCINTDRRKKIRAWIAYQHQSLAHFDGMDMITKNSGRLRLLSHIYFPELTASRSLVSVLTMRKRVFDKI